jgi:hypothetical protein
MQPKTLASFTTANALLLYICASLFFACGGPEDEGEQGGGEGSSASDLTFGQVALTSSTLNTAGLQSTETAPEDCSIQLDTYRGEGSCLTPLTVIGHASVLEADSDATDASGGSARIASTVNFHKDEQGKVIEGKEFDLSDETSFKAYNELWDQYEHQDTYNYLSLEMNYEKIKFKVKDKYVTLFLANYSQPFADWDLLDGCLSDEQKTYDPIANADVLDGYTFTRGDFLFCVKDTADASCSSSDFKWYDLDSNQLVSTRPDNPRVQQFLIFDEATCTGSDGEDGRWSFDKSPIRLGAQIDKPFKLYADFSNGVDSVQWPDSAVPFEDAGDNSEDERDDFQEPFLVYYHQAQDASEATEGTNLEMTFDFNTEDMLFFDGIGADEIATSSLEELLKVVYPKHDWFFHKRGLEEAIGFDVDQYSSMSVSPSITVSGGRTVPEDSETADE